MLLFGLYILTYLLTSVCVCVIEFTCMEANYQDGQVGGQGSGGPIAGEPISLEHPFKAGEGGGVDPAAEMKAAARKAATDLNVVGKAGEYLQHRKRNARLSEELSITDPDLRRQVEERRLDRMEGFLSHHDKGEEFLVRSVVEQKAVIEEIQKLILDDPVQKERALRRAREEAEIVQRLALGNAIREARGCEARQYGISDDEVKAHVEMYNKGEFHIEDRHYRRAVESYRYLMRDIFDSLMGLGGYDKGFDGFDPFTQVNRYM